MKNEQLLQMLEKRGLTVDALSDLIHSGRSHLTQVLHGQRNGTPTWNKLRKVLDEKELSCAMEFANLNLARGGLRLRLNEKQRVIAEGIPGMERKPLDPFLAARAKKMFHVEQTA